MLIIDTLSTCAWRLRTAIVHVCMFIRGRRGLDRSKKREDFDIEENQAAGSITELQDIESERPEALRILAQKEVNLTFETRGGIQ